ncbi:thioesterase II family protein [Noviherbaspirillum sedimenti]|uniref:Thioesterase n=1 Tax=Noviherbaspirillum sedimenti TaxID=2320865 RepID=A0A3A3FZ59_9BURK|nr:alpha/beta fold hydrolase [Noviherbaspirillum sedimenti]RJG00931.1 thioesterase [Noviherbaspirillum sedimenti]
MSQPFFPGERAAQSFLRPRPVAAPRLRLFCFPYAGGSATLYHQWPSALPADIELVAVQYPGRATRMREAPCTRLQALLDDIEAGILPQLDRPYAFFGHSMGATVAHELTRRLLAANRPLPKHLFLSGRSAPQLAPRKAPIHALPHAEFIAAMRGLNGTPAEILAHRELMEMLVPIIRADFEVLETWQYEPTAPHTIPLSVFGGIADAAVPLENLDAWADCTTARFKRHMFPGDHFFLQQHYPAMLNIVVRALESV